jgi:hypothetical protein
MAKDDEETFDRVVNTVKELGENMKPIIDAVSQTIGSIGDEVKPIFDNIQKAFGGIITEMKATAEKELSYEEAMRFFIKNKDTNKTIVKGAMMRESVNEGHILFTQVFLDKNNQLVCTETGVPMGRKLTVVSLDSELLKAFKDSALVIVS